MQFIANTVSETDLNSDVSDNSHQSSNDAQQLISNSIVNDIIQNFKFAYDDIAISMY